jgi:23S rRNA A2030 N6-methylase RlmJ
MVYDHSTKVGNQGDLVKHAALAYLASTLPEEKANSGAPDAS